MVRILIETYGCTLNQSDSELMRSVLERMGYDVEQGRCVDARKYNYVILNTCTVKAQTERKIIHRISELKALDARLIVAGCMASANRDLIAGTAPAASMIGTSNVARIAEEISNIEKNKKKVSCVEYEHADKLVERDCPFNAKGSVIARIPISEGCAGSCNFCITKFARGPLNSFSEKRILKAVEMSVANGAKEIELTSQDTGSYGLDRKTNIAELVSKVSQIPGDFRVRVGMLNPEHLHRYFDSLIEAYGSEKVYKFIHLPVQSGSNAVLKDMNRRYTVEDVENYVKELKSKIKRIGLWTDMIVGYPTETEDDFKESVEWLERTRPLVTNISKFSVRPRTAAAGLKKLGSEEVKRRCLAMVAAVRRIQEEDRRRRIGTRANVLITGKNGRSFEGRDASYNTVAVTGKNIDVGSYADIRITGCTFAYLIGKTRHQK